MASGKAHSTATIVTGVLCVTVLLSQDLHYAVVPATIGFLFQIFASPDRDVNGGTRSEYYIRIISPAISSLWKTIWKPYALSMKHRGESHSLYGTFFRIVYFVFPFSVFFFRDCHIKSDISLLGMCLVSQVLVLFFLLPLIAFDVSINFMSFMWFFLAVFLSDILHIIFDWVL